MNKLLGFLILIAAGNLFGQGNPFGNAETPKSLDRPTVTITADMISVGKEAAFELVRLDSSAMWAKLSELVKSGAATSEYLTSISVISEERAVLECIEELRYPTDFSMEDSLDFSGEQTAQDKAKPKAGASIAIYPEGFETRNIGATMEVSPKVAGNQIFLEIVPTHTKFKEFARYPSGKEKPEPFVEQPIFRTSKIQTKFVLKSGVPFFAGAGPLDPTGKPDPQPRWLFFFVTASIAK